MRKEPSWRLPVGIFGLMVALVVYGVVIARYAPGLIGEWPTLTFRSCRRRCTSLDSKTRAHKLTPTAIPVYHLC